MPKGYLGVLAITCLMTPSVFSADLGMHVRQGRIWLIIWSV